MATMALKAAPHVSWYRTARGGMYAMGAFIAIIGAFMTLRAIGVGPFGSLLASGELKATDRVLLADFSVSGGDTTLGRVVSDAVRAGLSQARTFTLVSPAELATALGRMRRPPNARLDMALSQQLAEREGFKAILDGNVASIGGSYIVSVRLVRADSGRELTSQRATASGPDQLIDASDEVTRKLLSKAGESLRRVQANPPLAQATTASIEALRKYSEGSRLNDMENDPVGAIAKLREAVAIDSNFAEAWRKLTVAIRNSGLPRAQGDSAVARAFALRDRLGDVERRRIEAYYWSTVPGRDRARVIAAYQALLDGGDSTLVINNLANEYRSRREYAKAETLYRAMLRRQPGSRLALGNLGFTLVRQDKQEAHDSLLAAALKANPDERDWRWAQLWAMRDRGRLDEYALAVDSARRARPDRRNPGQALWEASSFAFARGQFHQGVAYSREAAHLDSAVGRRVLPVQAAVDEVLSRADLDLPAPAELRKLESALAQSPLERIPITDRPVFAVVRAFAVAKRPDRARAILESYRAAADTSVRRARMPGEHDVLAEIAAAEQRWADAAAEARLADQLPDGPANGCNECLPRALMWVFSEAGMADSAIAAYAEYRKTPFGGRKWTGQDIGIPAPLLERMARMFLSKSDTTRAAEFLAQFVERWKSADPDLQPRVAAAREKLRRMQLDAPRR